MRRPLQPGIESLASRLLLSGTHHHVALAGQFAVVVPGNFQMGSSPNELVLTSVTVQATGNLGLGTPVALNATLTATDPEPTTLVLRTRRGTIDVSTNFSIDGASNVDGVTKQPYTVVGGTGAYAHATGSGTVEESITNDPHFEYLDVRLAFNRPIRDTPL